VSWRSKETAQTGHNKWWYRLAVTPKRQAFAGAFSSIPLQITDSKGDEMPLSVNVGLSRKASRDYQSAGYSINVTAELDQSLLAKPEQLQQQIADLYAQAEAALDRQAGEIPSPAASTVRANGRSATNGTNGHHQTNGNGHRNGDGMTASQRKAIQAIARRANIDPEQECHDLFGFSLNELTIRQASGFIDHLKEQAPEVNGRFSRR
jgi:hypothetical protein